MKEQLEKFAGAEDQSREMGKQYHMIWDDDWFDPWGFVVAVVLAIAIVLYCVLR